MATEAGAIVDARLHVKRGTNTRFDLVKYASLEDWQTHAKQVREQILTGCGLSPMPEKTPLNARISDRIDRGDYTVETVTFQSYPGLYVVGNLYRPKGKKGPFPVVLNTHGHGQNGRIHDDEQMSIPARCASFARLGMIAFAYSMIGYNENSQITHRFEPTRQQELWGISPGGLQLWNSIRAVDFVSTLPDADTKRIGCTGQSGGGTQTFMLSAVDDRIAVNAPVCMISATMQGASRGSPASFLSAATSSTATGSRWPARSTHGRSQSIPER
jgi:dienelactone hydrolase